MSKRCRWRHWNSYVWSNVYTSTLVYTSIPCEVGFEATDYFLTKYKEHLHPRFRMEFSRISELNT